MHYEAQLQWRGSTGAGWDSYDRAHTARARPAEQALTLTTGESKGDPAHLNPEQLVLIAASSCQMLWFLHLAAKARLDVVAYDDDAEAEMPDDRLTRIVLRPRITIQGDAATERVRKLCERAHEHCYVAKSLRCPVAVEPEVRVPDPARAQGG
jgi:organic hydroperoxide reductase OsmC/OhrA